MKPGDLVVNRNIRLPGPHPAFELWAAHPKGIVLGPGIAASSPVLQRFRVLRTDGQREFWYSDECEVISEAFSE